MAILLSALESLARKQHKDIIFPFVYAENGFTEPHTVYSVILEAHAAYLNGYPLAGIASDCYKQGNDPYGEGADGGLLLLNQIQSIARMRPNTNHFTSAKHSVEKARGVRLNNVALSNMRPFVKKYLDCKPIAFYTSTYVDEKKLEARYGRRIIWLRSERPSERAQDIFTALRL